MLCPPIPVIAVGTKSSEQTFRTQDVSLHSWKYRDLAIIRSKRNPYEVQQRVSYVIYMCNWVPQQSQDAGQLTQERHSYYLYHTWLWGTATENHILSVDAPPKTVGVFCRLSWTLSVSIYGPQRWRLHGANPSVITTISEVRYVAVGTLWDSA